MENQIGQPLTSTRERALEDWKSDTVFKTKSGTRNRSLGKVEWSIVSESVGRTTILAYLYRKRVKANYKDIDSLLRAEIRGPEILQGLIGFEALLPYDCACGIGDLPAPSESFIESSPNHCLLAA